MFMQGPFWRIRLHFAAGCNRIFVRIQKEKWNMYICFYEKGGNNMKNSEFNGGLLGLIGISILQALLAGVTLGFGVPWAV
jgi:hypothetical protein